MCQDIFTSNIYYLASLQTFRKNKQSFPQTNSSLGVYMGKNQASSNHHKIPFFLISFLNIHILSFFPLVFIKTNFLTKLHRDDAT